MIQPESQLPSLPLSFLHRRQFLSLVAGFAATIIGAARSRGRPELEGSIAPWRRGPEYLERWQRAVRTLVVEPQDDVQRRLLAAIQQGKRVHFRYRSGSQPGADRDVSPGQLYRVSGYSEIYLSGYCHLRRAERTFTLAAMTEIRIAV